MKVNKGGLSLTWETNGIMGNHKDGDAVWKGQRTVSQQHLTLFLWRAYLNMKNLDNHNYLLSTHCVLDSVLSALDALSR